MITIDYTLKWCIGQNTQVWLKYYIPTNYHFVKCKTIENYFFKPNLILVYEKLQKEVKKENLAVTLQKNEGVYIYQENILRFRNYIIIKTWRKNYKLMFNRSTLCTFKIWHRFLKLLASVQIKSNDLMQDQAWQIWPICQRPPDITPSCKIFLIFVKLKHTFVSTTCDIFHKAVT